MGFEVRQSKVQSILHLPANILGFFGGKKNFPATTQSYRIYIGTSIKNRNVIHVNSKRCWFPISQNLMEIV